MSTHGPKTRSLAEDVYPVRLRIIIPRTGLAKHEDLMRAWLQKNCGHGNYWADSIHMPGPKHFKLVYLSSADLAKAFVDATGCADLVECDRQVAIPLGCDVYRPNE